MASLSRTSPSLRLSVATSLLLVASSGMALGSGGTATAASPSATAPTSTASAAATAGKITLERSAQQRVESGKKVRFTGTATSLKGKRIVLQRKAAGEGWRVVGAATVTAAGTYAVSGKAKGAGANRFRTFVVTQVTKKGKKRVEKRAYSPRRSIWSLDWFHLYDSNSRTQRNYNRYVAHVGGRTYSKSFGTRAGSGAGWVETTLGGACDRFAAGIGQDDVSARGTSSRYSVTVNGVVTDVGAKGRGKARSVSLSVVDAPTIRLASSPASGARHSWAIWANPRVLCHKKP